MEKIEIYLTHEDAIRLEQARATAAEHDRHYANMTESEYAEILLHKFLNHDQTEDEV